MKAPLPIAATQTVLLISSQVASSRVGAGAAQFCLQRLGMETVVLPTVLMGRHPGWGAPGGGAVDVARLSEMWRAIRAQGLRFDAVLTGYMGDIAHIDLAAQIIGDIRADNPAAHIWVDPVMGDHGSLYIPKPRADAIRDRLVPLADCITPNLWELEWLSGRVLSTATEICAAARKIAPKSAPKALVTSVPKDGDIGAAWITEDSAQLCTHAKFDTVPHGGGDALGAIRLAHALRGLDDKTALTAAVGSIFDIMTAAETTDAGELPLVRCQQALIRPRPLSSQDFT